MRRTAERKTLCRGATAIVFELLIIAAFLCLALSANADSDPTPDSTDASVDVAPFGFAWVVREEDKTEYYPWLTDGSALSGASIDVGQSIQIDWRQPRSIARIVLRGYKLPKPEDVEISVWYRIWPDNGGGGWSRLDDPFNGEFVKTLTDDCTQD
ncbi:MAG: hypothetical protein WCL39_15695, partial [Armatimonadota bacterium]